MATASLPRVTANVVVPKPVLQQVFDNLRETGFTLIGPTVRDGVIVFDEIERIADLPVGQTDEQGPGHYRLKKGPDSLYFAYGKGPYAWKKFLNPPQVKLFTVQKENGDWSVSGPNEAVPRYAFVGVRACDLNAIALLDRVFMGNGVRDPHYAQRRKQVFVMAVNCTGAGPNCFCRSMKTGPRVTGAYDLALVELPDMFVIEIGSEAGSEALRGTNWEAATAFDLGRASQAMQNAERSITRELLTEDLPKLLFDNLEHPRWDATAERCLSCANCTMVCPTCFCTTVEDTTNLKGTVSERTRVWDSCFNLDFSHVHGGNIRPSTRSRYRQWLTHKLASWIEQFGTSGCVGCGRCITWCPVGIDLTEEIKAFRSSGAK